MSPSDPSEHPGNVTRTISRGPDAGEPESEQLRHEITRLRSRLDAADNDRAAAESDLGRLRQERRDLQDKLAETISALSQRRAELDDLRRQLDQTQSARDGLQHELNQVRIAEQVNIRVAERFEDQLQPLIQRLGDLTAQAARAELAHKTEMNAREASLQIMVDRELALRARHKALGERLLPIEAQAAQRSHDIARISVLLAQAEHSARAQAETVAQAESERNTAQGENRKHLAQIEALTQIQAELSAKVKTSETRAQQAERDSDAALTQLRAARKEQAENGEARIAELTAHLASARAEQEAAQNEAEEAIQARTEACEQLARLNARMQGLVEADTRLSLRTKTDQDEIRRVRQDSEAARAALARLQADHATLSQSHDSVLAQLNEATETVRAQAGIRRLLHQIAEAPTPWWQGAAARLRQRMDIVQASGLFDPEAYLQINPDVAEAGVDPLRHFVEFGLAEGRVALHPAGPDPVAAREPEQTR